MGFHGCPVLPQAALGLGPSEVLRCTSIPCGVIVETQSQVEPKRQYCRQCGEDFPDYKELARHILDNKNHRYGRKWAASVMMRVRSLDRKATLQDQHKNRGTLTEEERENLRDNRAACEREVSGKQHLTKCLCPTAKCHRIHYVLLPVEYLEDPCWRTKDGFPYITCPSCQR